MRQEEKKVKSKTVPDTILPFDSPLKFALAALIAVPLSFALGSVARKLPLAKRIL